MVFRGLTIFYSFEEFPASYRLICKGLRGAAGLGSPCMTTRVGGADRDGRAPLGACGPLFCNVDLFGYL